MADLLLFNPLTQYIWIAEVGVYNIGILLIFTVVYAETRPYMYKFTA